MMAIFGLSGAPALQAALGAGRKIVRLPKHLGKSPARISDLKLDRHSL